ncbi:MAG TPA: DUF6226 family protein [Nocardioidaceae bacterium]|nr:DUF6226 family protein [Nocardioidaceae bacterium]
MTTGDRWGPDGPPEEAYSRVTRDLATLYEPVVEAASNLVDRLEAAYDVTRRPARAAELDRLGACDYDRLEATTLVPASPEQAPLTIGTCDMPGVHLAYGRWASEHLPECGCDACDESAEALLQMMSGARDLVVGGFAEWIQLRTDGQWWLGHGTVIGQQGRSVDRVELRELGISPPIELAWRPWTPR